MNGIRETVNNNLTWFKGLVARKDCESVRFLFTGGDFFEIYVDCPPEVCETRDQKGIYKRARKDEVKDFTGISAPYGAPENLDLVIRSNVLSVEDASACTIRLIQKNKIINDPSQQDVKNEK